jgi:nucleoside-diphosphate-sugar epimerase
MKVFVAGATGVVGRRLLPKLLERGDEVVALARTEAKRRSLLEAGAKPVLADGLDREAVLEAVRAAEPEVVVHQMTALAGGIDVRRFAQSFARTNELRSRGTDYLLTAAREARVRRFVVQSYAGWPYAREGGPVKTESDPLDPSPPPRMRPTLESIRHLESAVTCAPNIEGVVLRYGGFYGPGTSLARDGEHTELIRRRKFPLVGGGTGVWSFVHVDDVAEATLAAIDRGAPGVYNVADDEPAPVRTWLPHLARVLGAKPPLRVPAWVGRLATGEHGLAMMTSVRGASNAKAKRELDWQPAYASWRQGFEELAGVGGAR